MNSQSGNLPSPFYRVTSRAIILQDNRLVVVKDDSGYWQMPGGGWEHEESFEDCLRREVMEELGVGIKAISADTFMYRVHDQRGYLSLRIACFVTPESYDFVPGDDMVEVRLLSKSDFLALTFSPGEGPIQDFADRIWPD
jgi:8-oxo-dGTP diphosphatase